MFLQGADPAAVEINSQVKGPIAELTQAFLAKANERQDVNYAGKVRALTRALFVLNESHRLHENSKTAAA